METLVFHKNKISTGINSNSMVHKVTFIVNPGATKELDHSYYMKYNDLSRSNNLGAIQNEKVGYEILHSYEVEVPNFLILEEKGKKVLVTEQIRGNSLNLIEDIDDFELLIKQLINSQFKMWIRSSQDILSTPMKFNAITHVYPLNESMRTIDIIYTQLGKLQPEVAKEFIHYLNKVADTLRLNQQYDTQLDQDYYFQHGDETLNNCIRRSTDNHVVMIDPFPIITNRLERALNKLIGGSVLFSFDKEEFDNLGNSTKLKSIINLGKTLNEDINKIYAERQSGKISVLREIVFVNLSRIYFGIYNKENREYFSTKDPQKYLELAIQLYEALS